MKVLVLGGTQFNGLALVRELVRTGHDVTILNRGKSPGAVPRGVRRLVADRTDLASMRAALGSEDYDVVHDVTAYRPEDVAFGLEHFRGRTGHYVFVSSTVIYAASDLLPIHEDFPVDRSPQQNEYGRNKLLCEDLLVRAHREHGFPATTVCLSMVFGPHNILPDREQRMFVRLAQGRPILIPGDGTTLAQVGHVDDQARALRMLMAKPVTFGRRYNLTGADFFSAEGYVDCFARVVGVEPNKVFIPAALMDDLFDGRVVARPVQVKSKVDTRGTERPDEIQRNRFLLSMLVQRIAPHIHRWNRNIVFGIDRLRQDVGFEPEYRFPSAVAQTYEWFQAERVAEKQSFDFSFEDEVLRLVQAARGRSVWTIAVTGAASGMCAATAARLEQDGHRVIRVDWKGGDVVADLGTAAGRSAAVEGVRRLAGDALDGLVSGAGLGPYDDPAAVVRVNYFGAVAVFEALHVPGFAEACLAGDEASALARIDGKDGNFAYANAKHALALAVRQRAPAWGAAGIRLNAVLPGKVTTPMLARIHAHEVLGPTVAALPVPLGREAQADELAAAIAFLLGPDSRYVHGALLKVDGGADAIVRPNAL